MANLHTNGDIDRVKLEFFSFRCIKFSDVLPATEQRQKYTHSILCLDQPLHKQLLHSVLTAIVFCFKQKSTIMFFSLVVVSLLLVSGRAASDLDPNTEGEDEMEYAVVSLNFSLQKSSNVVVLNGQCTGNTAN